MNRQSCYRQKDSKSRQLWRAVGKPSTWFPPGRLVEQKACVKLFSPWNWRFLKTNLSQSKAPFQDTSNIWRSNMEALKYKELFECNRITNQNQNINKTNEKHVKKYRSLRTPRLASICQVLFCSCQFWLLLRVTFSLRFLRVAFCKSLVLSAALLYESPRRKLGWRFTAGSPS